MEIKDSEERREVTVAPIPKLPKKKLILTMKFPNSDIDLPAYVVPLGFLSIMLMILIEPLFLLIAIPVVLAFIGGIVMETISLDYINNPIEQINTLIPITEEE
jgi:hypothetical protein